MLRRIRAWLVSFRKPVCAGCGRRAALYRPPGKRALCGCCWTATARLLAEQLAEANALRCRTKACGSRKF
jgi:hypothetical protein